MAEPKKQPMEPIETDSVLVRNACANWVRANGIPAERIFVAKHWEDPQTGKYVAQIRFHVNGDEPMEEFIEKWSNKIE